VTKYTTEIAMDDLDDVRGFLGYPRIDLYGGSYGTRAAIVYARRHPEHTGAVILDGVSPPDMRVPLYMARDSQRALELLFRDCANDAGCRARFPNLRQRLETLLVRLGAHPQHTRYVHPRTGLETEMDVTRLTVTSILFAALYSPKTAALIPLMIEQGEQGNFSSLLALRAAYDPVWKSIARGMHFSVLCSEDAPRIEAGSVQREAAGTFLGTTVADAHLEPCQFWPRAPIDAGYYANTPSDLPALILSGDLDPVTPPSWGRQVASQWRNSRHVIVPGTGHGTAPSGFVMKVMARFLEQGSASNLDASCVERLKRPPFFLGPSGPGAPGEVAK
jgi:pimeloyl-ACP methyl ester carboxylesterase